MNEYEAINALKNLKRDYSLSQAALGQIFGYSASQMSRVLGGKRPITKKEAAYFYNISWLYRHKKWDPKPLAPATLLHARLALGYNQAEAARLFNIEISHLRKMERGTDEISALTCCKVHLEQRRAAQFKVTAAIEPMDTQEPEEGTAQIPAEATDVFERVMPRIIDGEHLWIVADVCRAIGHSNPTMAVGSVDGDDLKRVEVDRAVGPQWAVNEPGLYTLLLRSNLPKARPFRRWVTTEVLPEIRRTGSYAPAPPVATAPGTELQSIVAQVAQMIGFVGQQQQSMQQQIDETRRIAEQSVALAAEQAAQKLQSELMTVDAVKAWVKACAMSFVSERLRRGDRLQGKFATKQELYSHFWIEVNTQAMTSSFSDVRTLQQAERARVAVEDYARRNKLALPGLLLPMEFED